MLTSTSRDEKSHLNNQGQSNFPHDDTGDSPGREVVVMIVDCDWQTSRLGLSVLCRIEKELTDILGGHFDYSWLDQVVGKDERPLLQGIQ